MPFTESPAIQRASPAVFLGKETAIGFGLRPFRGQFHNFPHSVSIRVEQSSQSLQFGVAVMVLIFKHL